MKRIIVFTAVIIALCMGSATQAASVGDMIVMYIPNRIIDATDIISISFGIGPAVRGDFWATRAMAFGGGIGPEIKIVKGYNRQYGFDRETGWEVNLMMFSAESKSVEEATRYVKKYYYSAEGLANPGDRVYDFTEGARDYWSVGLNAALCGEMDVEIHFVEILDFLAGVFFLDIKKDDYSINDLID